MIKAQILLIRVFKYKTSFQINFSGRKQSNLTLKNLFIAKCKANVIKKITEVNVFNSKHFTSVYSTFNILSVQQNHSFSFQEAFSSISVNESGSYIAVLLDRLLMIKFEDKIYLFSCENELKRN